MWILDRNNHKRLTPTTAGARRRGLGSYVNQVTVGEKGFPLPAIQNKDHMVVCQNVFRPTHINMIRLLTTFLEELFYLYKQNQMSLSFNTFYLNHVMAIKASKG